VGGRGRIFRLSGFSRETGWPRQLYTGPTQRDYVPLGKR
jgi:hypothetical protein